jgi:hypothetical protein
MTRNDRSARASGGSAAVGPLDEGRAHFRARAWADAFAALSEADRTAPFTTAEDLELLGIAAALSAHEAEFIKVLERQYTLHVEAGATARAARVAFTLCMRLRGMGAMGQAAGWPSLATCWRAPCCARDRPTPGWHCSTMQWSQPRRASCRS